MNTTTTTTLHRAVDPHDDGARVRALDTALWLFIGVSSTFFALFITAYAMRMDVPDWSPIALPWQLWPGTALLGVGSVLLQRAVPAARAMQAGRVRRLLLGGAAAVAGFVAVQLWGWQSLIDRQVLLAGNPAASFFYVLTALHGLHVLGGLVAWSVAAQVLGMLARPDALAAGAWRIVLCARYWHFLLVVWVLLFATLGWLTPEIVRFLCGRS